jgi:hypothetical protein
MITEGLRAGGVNWEKMKAKLSLWKSTKFHLCFYCKSYDILKVLNAVVKSVHRISFCTLCGSGHVDIIRCTRVWTFCFHSRGEFLTVI